jgi:hypothetical protein
MKSNKTIDLIEARKYLSYDPANGNFTWIVNVKKGRSLAGKTAGRLSNGYVMIKFQQIEIQAHRLAWLFMTGSMPEYQVDHIDRNRSNNAWKNLRHATNKQNHENLPTLIASNTSGHKGVRFDARRGKWFAFIGHNGRLINLGRYMTKELAINARIAAERRYFTHAIAA